MKPSIRRLKWRKRLKLPRLLLVKILQHLKKEMTLLQLSFDYLLFFFFFLGALHVLGLLNNLHLLDALYVLGLLSNL